MFRRIRYLSSIFFIAAASLVLRGSISAQIQEELLKFRKSEQQTWKMYIENFRDYSSRSNFDVTFYHLDIEIAVESPYIQGSVLCRFKVSENNVQDIKLNLYRSLLIDSISGNVQN